MNGLLDVARLAYKETTEDVNRMLQELKGFEYSWLSSQMLAYVLRFPSTVSIAQI